MPAYEWAFSDVNPPVHAWAALRVYKIERRIHGRADRAFSRERVPQAAAEFYLVGEPQGSDGRNVFEGGFLGLDNIGVFDRSQPLPTGGHIEQSDGTSWMAVYCLNMLAIALELATEDPAYEDVASKFFEHFVYIADAMNDIGGHGHGPVGRGGRVLLRLSASARTATSKPLKVRSMVGLIPLFAVDTLEPEDAGRAAGILKGACSGSWSIIPTVRNARGPKPENGQGTAAICSRLPRAGSWSACCAMR